jgi:hypothetical protein
LKDQPSFTVLPYNRENLALALSNEFISAKDLLRVGSMIPEVGATATAAPAPPGRLLQGGNLFNFPYLLTYLDQAPSGIGAKTILVEAQFTSRDFLMDYASYYATCKRQYAKVCKRVHFFDQAYTHADLEAWLFPAAQLTASALDPSAAYLGYVVVKPIPFSFMGTTVLKPFSNPSVQRVYSVTREYKVNLFGKVLKLNSLAFQSQDKATSACASSALWSAFHKTSTTFQTLCPSPSEITVFSGNLFTSEGRTFPNSGLDHHQLCKAIEQVGLVSELRNNFVDWRIQAFKGFIYSYLKLGLPVLLGMEIKGAEKHLVTLTGYRVEHVKEPRAKGFNLVSDSILRFYAHDDQLGPFSRLTIEKTEESDFPNGIKIITGWPEKNDFEKLKAAYLTSVVIPVHQFMRISFEEVYHLTMRLDAMLDEGGVRNVWDIFLDDGSRLKTEFSKLQPPSGKLFSLQYLQTTLLEQIPRFVWRALLHIQGLLVMELLFDATDVPRGHYLLAATFYHPGFQHAMLQSLTKVNGVFAKQIEELFGAEFKQILMQGAEVPIFQPNNELI